MNESVEMEVNMRNWIGMVVHNGIAHPLMCVLPRAWGERFHDWTIERFWPAPATED